MTNISNREISRKFLHIITSIVPLSYLWIIKDKQIMVVVCLILTVIAVVVEFTRNRVLKFREIFNHHFGFMLREKESEGWVTGATWMVAGWTTTTILFPMNIAVPALLFLSVGDSFAALVGQMYPIVKIHNKSLSGTLAGIITSIIAGILINQSLHPFIIVVGAISAMIIELVPLPLNDNIIIPNFSVFMMLVFLGVL